MKRFAALLLPFIITTAMAKDAPVFDPAADAGDLATSFIEVDNLEALAGVKRVAISQFRVEFAVENSAKATSSTNTGWTSTRSQVKLVGVPTETLQQVADALQDRLVEDLASAGIEVISHDLVKENAAYKSLAPVLRTSSEPLGTQTGKSVFIGGHGTPYYLTNDDKHLGLGTMLGGFSTTQPQNIEPSMAKELDATVLRVTVMVAFADQKTSGGMFRSSSSVDTELGLTIIPKITGMLAITPGSGKARATLGESIVMGNEIFELRTAKKEGYSILSGVYGDKKYEAVTTPEAYSGLVTRYGQAVQAAIVAAIRGGMTQ